MNTSSFFKNFFNNARHNGVLILNKNGTIININQAFSLRFGYATDDLTGKNFEILFTEKDKATKKPGRELQEVLSQGSANDENYLLNKEGTKIWVTGESVLVENDEDTYIIKVVHNIHAQKQLERFLLESHEFIDTVFDSIDESALLILDSRLRVMKSNHAFLVMFGLKQPPAEGCRLTELDHPFWQKADVKQELINYLVMNQPDKQNEYDIENGKGGINKIILKAKLVEGIPGKERKLLVMIKYAATHS